MHPIRNPIRTLGLAALLLFAAAGGWGEGAPAPPAPAGTFGLLVMAHGGSADWNQAILDAVAPLRDRYPVEVAFGMADACSIQGSVRALEARGVQKIGVLRLFVSGESWYERTGQILGLEEGAPAAGEGACKPAGKPDAKAGAEQGSMQHGAPEHSAMDHGMSMELFRIASPASFALSREGLAEAPEMGDILAERAVALSHDPGKEDVLILAHGPGDDAENERWLANLDLRAEAVRKARPFHRVAAMTLREDWPDKRQAAEQRARDFVQQAAAAGRQAIVIPFRLFGFGPYDEVFAGEKIVADHQGLLPHASVTRWIARQADELRAKLAAPPTPK